MAEHSEPQPAAEEQPKIWEKPWLPPPWSAVEDAGVWKVVCDGYDDETPVVAIGDPNWPLSEPDALEAMVDAYRDDGCEDDADQPSMVRQALRALAKARGEA